MDKAKDLWNLLDCPFCGGRPELKASPFPLNEEFNQVRIVCSKCHTATMAYMDGINVYGHATATSEAIERAVSAWNKRNGMQNISDKLRILNETISGAAQIIGGVMEEMK